MISKNAEDVFVATVSLAATGVMIFLFLSMQDVSDGDWVIGITVTVLVSFVLAKFVFYVVRAVADYLRREWRSFVQTGEQTQPYGLNDLGNER